MERDQVLMSTMFKDWTTDAFDEELTAVSAFALFKLTSDSGEPAWSARSGGVPLSSEELLGALEGLVTSIRRDLANDWEW